MTVTLAQFMERCPDDVDILEYAGLTKPCVWRCVRCKQTYTHLPSRLQHNKVNCRCNGFAGSVPVGEFLARMKNACLDYEVLSYRAYGKKAKLRCSKGHEFEAVPFHIIDGRNSCKICSSQKRADYYRDKYLADLAAIYPNITPESYSPRRRRSWYKCDCGYRWQSAAIVMNGRRRRAGCKYCNWKPGGPKLKTVEFGSRVIYVQGYEDVALQYLETRLNPELLVTCKEDGLPYISYVFKGNERLYMPDFYYPPKEQIIEVKSIFTLMSVDYAKTVEKREACRNQGYKFKLVLVHEGRVLRVPRNWYTLSRKELGAVLADRYPEFAAFTLKCSRTKRNVWGRS